MVGVDADVGRDSHRLAGDRLGVEAIDVEGLDAEAIARRAMDIAADICVYTNHNLVIEKL